MGEEWLKNPNFNEKQMQIILEFNKQYWWFDRYDVLTLLQQELIYNDFEHALKIDNKQTLTDIAMEVAMHPRHA